MYDWTKFDIHFFIQASPAAVFERWSTPSGLESFFVKRATVEGDRYEWEWFFDYSSSGKILKVVPDRLVAFTFGKCKVEVKLKPFEQGTLVHLRQSGMDPSEQDMVHIHLDCRGGWIYFLTNLKAVLEHGVDVRDKRADTSQSLAVDFSPPNGEEL